MRVGFFGNMNNNFFALVRYCRDRGIDAHLLQFRKEQQHFQPICDALDSDFEAYTHQLDWDKAAHLAKTPSRTIRRQLADFDIIVGCGLTPAYAAKAGRTVDMLIPYGQEIVDALSVPRPIGWDIRRWLRRNTAFRRQRQGIRDCRSILTDMRVLGPLLDRLEYGGKRRNAYVPLVYDYTNTLLSEGHELGSPVIERFRTIRANSDFLVFHQSRHIWKTELDEVSWKGNDHLLRGFAAFQREHPQASPQLVLFEYGPDVDASKQLIRELGIQDFVSWFPVSQRREILYGLLLSDVATGQFGVPCTNNGATQEALVCGKPLIHRRGDIEQCPDYYGLGKNLYPVLDAANDGEIAAHLRALYENSEWGRSFGQSAQRWYREQAVSAFFELFWSTVGQTEPTQAQLAD